MRGGFHVEVQIAEGETLSEGAIRSSVEPTLGCRTGKQEITGSGPETRFVLKTLHFSTATTKMATAATAVVGSSIIYHSRRGYFVHMSDQTSTSAPPGSNILNLRGQVLRGQVHANVPIYTPLMCEPLHRQRLPHFAHRLTSLELLNNGMSETFPVLLDTLFLDCCELSAPMLMIEHVAAGTGLTLHALYESGPSDVGMLIKTYLRGTENCHPGTNLLRLLLASGSCLGREHDIGQE